VATRSLAAPPPNISDVIHTLADPKYRACPMGQYDIIHARGGELPAGVSPGDFVISSAELTGQLIGFAIGERCPPPLMRMEPEVIRKTYERSSTRRLHLLEKLEHAYSYAPAAAGRGAPPTFLWHLLHTAAPKHVLRAALAFAEESPQYHGKFEPSSSFLAAAAPPPDAWRCKCGTRNPHDSAVCRAEACNVTHCSLCRTPGHPAVLCRNARAWTAGLALKRHVPGQPRLQRPPLPPWLELPPFQSAVLGVVEWSDQVFKFLHKGARHFWIPHDRAKLARGVLQQLGADGRLR